MIDLDELKKLPDQEKLRIIDLLEESLISEEDVTDAAYKEGLNQLLNERLATYHGGKSKSYTWEEVQERLQVIRQKNQIGQNA